MCGKSEVNVTGFMPPSFDQNEDTFRAIDNIGFAYDAGFQAGLIYAPGHEEDVWPYQVKGYNFYAVPISTVNVSGVLMPLYDKKMAEEGVGADEWTEILEAKFDEAAANDEPVVVVVCTSVSGDGEFLDALKEFLDYAVSKNAAFVNARDLVTMSKTGSLTPPEPTVSECATCGEDEVGDIAITLVETLAPELGNETAENATEEIEA